MGAGETIQFGNTGINRADALKMGEEAFRKTYRGVLNYDLTEAWAKIKGESPSVMMTSTNGNPEYKNKNRKPKPGAGEAKAEEAPAEQ